MGRRDVHREVPGFVLQAGSERGLGDLGGVIRIQRPDRLQTGAETLRHHLKASTETEHRPLLRPDRGPQTGLSLGVVVGRGGTVPADEHSSCRQIA